MNAGAPVPRSRTITKIGTAMTAKRAIEIGKYASMGGSSTISRSAIAIVPTYPTPTPIPESFPRVAGYETVESVAS